MYFGTRTHTPVIDTRTGVVLRQPHGSLHVREPQFVPTLSKAELPCIMAVYT